MRRLVAAALVAVAVGAPANAAPTHRVVVAFVPDFAPGRTVPDAAVGALVVTTARRTPCAADAWLTLSAGAPAALPGNGCAPTPADWPAIVRANAARHHGAVPGALATALADDDRCISASGPLAWLGASDKTGGLPSDGPCDTVFVDTTDAPSFDAARARLGAPRGPDVMVLVGLPRSGHLGAVAVVGDRGLLRGSTRRDGLVTLADVGSYVRDGSSLTTASGNARDVAEIDRREHLHRRYAGWFFGGLGVIHLAFAYVVGIRRRRPRRTALLVAAYPAAGFVASLYPWWNASHPAVAVVAAIAVSTLLLGGLANSVGVAALCAALFAGDLLTGGHLQETGLASYSAIAGGRFYGLGNVGFAVLATAAVVVCGAAARRYGTRAWFALLPVIALDALAAFGSDFGGAIALTGAFSAAVATRARRTAIVAGTVAGVAVATGAAVLDYARPAADRTHLGRFVGEVLHGGWTDTIARKADAATHSVTGTLYPLLVAGAVAVAISVLRRLRDPSLDVTVRALVVLWVVGSLVNDSGILVAAVGIAVAEPLLVAYAAERT